MLFNKTNYSNFIMNFILLFLLSLYLQTNFYRLRTKFLEKRKIKEKKSKLTDELVYIPINDHLISMIRDAAIFLSCIYLFRCIYFYTLMYTLTLRNKRILFYIFVQYNAVIIFNFIFVFIKYIVRKKFFINLIFTCQFWFTFIYSANFREIIVFFLRKIKMGLKFVHNKATMLNFFLTYIKNVVYFSIELKKIKYFLYKKN